MSEFFKAAVKCDVAVAPLAPMSIDQRGVMREVFIHQQLVERVLATKQLLDDLDAADHAEKTRERTATRHNVGSSSSSSPSSEPKTTDCRGSGEERGAEDALRELLAAENADGEGAVPGPYLPPPLSTIGMLPENRPPGGKAVHRAMQDRIEQFRKLLDARHDELQSKESAEAAAAEREAAKRRELAAREFDALLTARQQAAAEVRREIEASRIHIEKTQRHVHPIDVLQKKIAADLMAEIHESTVLAERELEEGRVGVEGFVEDEQLRALRYKYYSPSKHIPSGLV